jgi:MraZ protein
MPEPEVILDKNYLGFARHGIDEKRRLQIPARWRPSDTKIDLTLLIWKGHDEGVCLRVFPPKEMQALRDKIVSMPPSKKKKALEWSVGVNSESVMVEKTGRICLPERMAKAAGIKGEAVFVGLLDKFEIWAPERHAPQEEAYDSVASEYFDELT